MSCTPKARLINKPPPSPPAPPEVNCCTPCVVTVVWKDGLVRPLKTTLGVFGRGYVYTSSPAVSHLESINCSIGLLELCGLETIGGGEETRIFSPTLVLRQPANIGRNQ